MSLSIPSIYGLNASLNVNNMTKPNNEDSCSIFPFMQNSGLGFGQDDLFTDLLPFMDTMSLFNAFSSGIMSESLQKELFTDIDKYNTKTDIKALNNVYNSELAKRLASIAAHNAKEANTIGWCAKIATNSLCDAGVANTQIKCASAYQVAGKLNNNKNFKQVSVSKEDLKNLPAGCVIVWQPYNDSKGNYHEHGHIAVTLGNGKEASDHVQNIANINSLYSVFVPTATNTKA